MRNVYEEPVVEIIEYEVEKIYEGCYFSGWFWDKDQ